MDYNKQKEYANKYAAKVKQKQELYDIKHRNDKPKEKLSFSKKAFVFMIANCIIIEIYSLFMMAFYEDLSSLPTLIVAVIGECICTVSYYIKAKCENTQGGIIYETALRKLDNSINEINSDSVG